MATPKKAISLPAKTNPQAPAAETVAKETFVERTENLCRHVAAWRGLEDVDDLYESTTTLLHQVSALFEGIYSIVGDSGEEDLLVLCVLGKDLAQEAKRRVERLHDHT